MADNARFPENVGIVAAEIYFPKTFVDQTELEAFDGASKGKYTIGLGQDEMAFTGDLEDIHSVCLTVVQNLLEKYSISPSEIGRLEVGTETIIDKSKSVKSVLMTLFADSGSSDIEGIDTTNACYGGTNALFNSINWIESSSWDGRYALVVCGDIAVYAEGAARPTGGCGAVAMVLGPNAPIVFERKVRCTHMEHAWDFYKPRLDSEYPTVDGKLSVGLYLRALDKCYAGYRAKFAAQNGGKAFDMTQIDYATFHSPFNKLVSKSFGRFLYGDLIANPAAPHVQSVASHAAAAAAAGPEVYENDFLKAFVTATEAAYERIVGPSTVVSRRCGNIYTASVYGGLLSLVASLSPDELLGKRIMLFSYGSGLASSLFSAKVVGSTAAIRERLNLVARLDSRVKKTPTEFVAKLVMREHAHDTTPPFAPVDSLDDLFDGTYYLTGIDAQYRRTYARK
eukprot:a177449_134.p1 GENE.a177449_134~~a177449_134.p1  ORF type:complete len:463 (+),score=210.79 a177449_134:32-1390(+)